MDRVAVATVFVVQLDPKRRLNLAPAREYGNLEVLLDGDDQVVLSAAPTVKELKTKLRKFTDADYILAIGDPVAIGMACAIVAAGNDGRYKMLKWDRKMDEGRGGYWAVQVEL